MWITLKEGDMRIIRILLVVLFLLPLVSFAEGEKLPVNKVDEKQKKESAIDKREQLQKFAESRIKETYNKCMLSFGESNFCLCLCKNLPIATTFENYISIMTSTKDGLGYNNRSNDEKKLIDLTIKAREMCVKEVSAKEIKKK